MIHRLNLVIGWFEIYDDGVGGLNNNDNDNVTKNNNDDNNNNDDGDEDDDNNNQPTKLSVGIINAG